MQALENLSIENKKNWIDKIKALEELTIDKIQALERHTNECEKNDQTLNLEEFRAEYNAPLHDETEEGWLKVNKKPS